MAEDQDPYRRGTRQRSDLGGDLDRGGYGGGGARQRSFGGGAAYGTGYGAGGLGGGADRAHRGRDDRGGEPLDRAWDAPGVTPGGRRFTSLDFRGRGPRGHRRSDARIYEDVCERLTDDPKLDASQVEVRVSNGEVSLDGQVATPEDRRRAEVLAEDCRGVEQVHNNLRADRRRLSDAP